MEFSQASWKLRLILHVHLVLIVNALLSRWIAPAYVFYNLIFLISLFWVIGSRDSAEAVNTAFAIDFLSILFDIIIVGYFVVGSYGTVFVIINAIFRLVSIAVLHAERKTRGVITDI